MATEIYELACRHADLAGARRFLDAFGDLKPERLLAVVTAGAEEIASTYAHLLECITYADVAQFASVCAHRVTSYVAGDPDVALVRAGDEASTLPRWARWLRGTFADLKVRTANVVHGLDVATPPYVRRSFRDIFVAGLRRSAHVIGRGDEHRLHIDPSSDMNADDSINPYDVFAFSSILTDDGTLFVHPAFTADPLRRSVSFGTSAAAHMAGLQEYRITPGTAVDRAVSRLRNARQVFEERADGDNASTTTAAGMIGVQALVSRRQDVADVRTFSMLGPRVPAAKLASLQLFVDEFTNNFFVAAYFVQHAHGAGLVERAAPAGVAPAAAVLQAGGAAAQIVAAAVGGAPAASVSVAAMAGSALLLESAQQLSSLLRRHNEQIRARRFAEHFSSYDFQETVALVRAFAEHVAVTFNDPLGRLVSDGVDGGLLTVARIAVGRVISYVMRNDSQARARESFADRTLRTVANNVFGMLQPPMPTRSRDLLRVLERGLIDESDFGLVVGQGFRSDVRYRASNDTRIPPLLCSPASVFLHCGVRTEDGSCWHYQRRKWRQEPLYGLGFRLGSEALARRLGMALQFRADPGDVGLILLPRPSRLLDPLPPPPAGPAAEGDDVAVLLDVTPRHGGGPTRLLVPLPPTLARAVVVAAAIAAGRAPLAAPLAVPFSSHHGNALVLSPAQLGTLAAGVSRLRRALGQARETVQTLHLQALEVFADSDAAAQAAAAELRRVMRQ